MLRSTVRLATLSRISSTLSKSSPKKTSLFNSILFKREISSRPLTEKKDHSFVTELRNDMPKADLASHSPKAEAKSIEIYSNKSWKQFLALKKPDHFYIFLDKAVSYSKPIKMLHPGHICCYFTCNAGNIINKTFVSLRPGKEQRHLELKYTLKHEQNPKERTNPVWKVEFTEEPEKEFKTHFFEQNPINTNNKRFLIGVKKELITTDLDGLTNHIQTVKGKLSQQLYILADGTLEDRSQKNDKTTTSIDMKSLNCVTGVYYANGFEGTVPNPSPQMAAWTLLSELLGKEVRDFLISGTGIKAPETGERLEDDKLQKLKKD